jgi:radical SAM-linked protein
VEVQYSEGFNPRPRLSLPLPRSVGVESDDELLALVAGCRADRTLEELSEWIKKGLSAELPRGCSVVSVVAVRGGNAPQPCSATYVLAVRPDYVNDELSNRIEHLLTSDTLVVRRQTDAKASRFKDVDVRGFLRSVELKDGCVSVECEISLAGSVRVEEILELLGLDVEKLDRPIKRTRVQWRSS